MWERYNLIGGSENHTMFPHNAAAHHSEPYFPYGSLASDAISSVSRCGREINPTPFRSSGAQH